MTTTAHPGNPESPWRRFLRRYWWIGLSYLAAIGAWVMLPVIDSKTLPEWVNVAKGLMPKPKPADVKIEWVTIPAGEYLMGSHIPKDGPPHRVSIKEFQIAKSPVTNRQYNVCVAAGACQPPSKYLSAFSDDDQPVVLVTWEEAKTFSEWVGGRLPSEAEWEYAARSAGKDRLYPWGNEEATCERAVVSDPKSGGNGCGRHATLPVCSRPRGDTVQGLCDMGGNIMHWLQDFYHPSYFSAPNDGSAWIFPKSPMRVQRGGAWCFEKEQAQTTVRGRGDPLGRAANIGFRPAR